MRISDEMSQQEGLETTIIATIFPVDQGMDFLKRLWILAGL